jgi:hypothetical protein
MRGKEEKNVRTPSDFVVQFAGKACNVKHIYRRYEQHYKQDRRIGNLHGRIALNTEYAAGSFDAWTLAWACSNTVSKGGGSLPVIKSWSEWDLKF